MFQAWPKIPRWENEKFFFTEKIDGTNACIIISSDPEIVEKPITTVKSKNPDQPNLFIFAQSRTRLIYPGDDNFGFAAWVKENAHELVKLGEGYHYGEWWGKGIQRGYDIEEKRFSLFNTKRWGPHNPTTPQCVSVVPTIHASTLEEAHQKLVEGGSLAAPGYMNVEGIVMYMYQTDQYYKHIINKPKGG